MTCLESKYTEYTLRSLQLVKGVTTADRNWFIKFVSLKSEAKSQDKSSITAFNQQKPADG